MEALLAEFVHRKPKRAAAAGAGEAAVAVLLCEEEFGPEIFFIRRALHPQDPWSGQVGLPGGRRDPEDMDLLATVVRETHEETAVALSKTHLRGELDDLAPQHPSLPPVVIRPFLFLLKEKPPIEPSAEVAGYFWTPIKELKACEGRTMVEGRGSRFEADAYLAPQAVIWGITRKIIKPLVDALAQRRP